MSQSCYITAKCDGESVDVDLPRAAWGAFTCILNDSVSERNCGTLPLPRFYDAYALLCVLSALRPVNHPNEAPANELLGKAPGYYRLDRSSADEENLPQDNDTLCALSWWARRMSRNMTSWTGDDPIETIDLDSEFFDLADEALDAAEKIAEWLRKGKEVDIIYYT